VCEHANETQRDDVVSGDATTLGQRIRRVRGDAGLSQEALAQLAGVTLRAVSYWEADARNPNLESLRRISGATGCSLWWLVHGTGSDPEQPTTPALRPRLEQQTDVLAKTVARMREEAERAG
jgi:putative transcriptional regulator